MKKIDFRKLEIENIEGKTDIINIAFTLGNMMYMQGQNIEECELGRTIYRHSKVDASKESFVELTSEQVIIVRKYMNNFSFIVRKSVEKQLD